MSTVITRKGPFFQLDVGNLVQTFPLVSNTPYDLRDRPRKSGMRIQVLRLDLL